MLPLHEIATTLGSAKTKVMVKAHILTGEIVMSKVYSKHAAIALNPDVFLKNFGEDPTLIEDNICLAEEYIVKVKAEVKAKPLSSIFDGFRHEKYTSANTGMDNLPLTSRAVRAYIHRGAYLVYNACNLLNPDKPTLDPLEYGVKNDLA